MGRRGSPPASDAELLGAIQVLSADLPTYGYRRIHALLRRQAERDGRPAPNAKRIYRVMKVHGLLLQRHAGEPRRAVTRARWRWPRATPAGRLPVRSPTGWDALCSDRLEIAAENGERVWVACPLHCCDREAMSCVATMAGITGEDVRDLMVAAVEHRFGPVNQLPSLIEWLTDNVLRSEEGRLARQQVSVREHAPAVCLSSTSIQAAPADPDELSAIANTGSSRCTRHRGPHRPQHEMSIQAGDPSIIYRVVVLTPSRLC